MCIKNTDKLNILNESWRHVQKRTNWSVKFRKCHQRFIFRCQNQLQNYVHTLVSFLCSSTWWTYFSESDCCSWITWSPIVIAMFLTWITPEADPMITVLPWLEVSQATTGELFIIGSISVISRSISPVSTLNIFAAFLLVPTAKIVDLSGFMNLQL